MFISFKYKLCKIEINFKTKKKNNYKKYSFLYFDFWRKLRGSSDLTLVLSKGPRFNANWEPLPWKFKIFRHLNNSNVHFVVVKNEYNTSYDYFYQVTENILFLLGCNMHTIDALWNIRLFLVYIIPYVY